MLTSASDYKFVKTTDVSQFITGSIMPVIFPKANTKAFVRYEDYLFLLEGFYERMNPESEGDNNVLPATRTLYRSKILGTVFSPTSMYISGPSIGYGNQRAYYINPESTVSLTPIIENTAGTGPTKNILGDYITDVPLNAVAYYSSKRPFYSGKSPLWSDYIRARYYDLKNATRMYFQLQVGDLATSSTTYYYDKDGNEESSSTNYLGSNIFGTLILTQNYYDSSEYKSFKRSECKLNLKEKLFTMPYAKSAKLIYVSQPHSSASGSSTSYQMISSIDLNITNGEIECPSDLIDTIINDSLHAVGLELYDTTKYVSLGLYNCSLLVDFDFPANLDDIDWDWEP